MAYATGGPQEWRITDPGSSFYSTITGAIFEFGFADRDPVDVGRVP